METPEGQLQPPLLLCIPWPVGMEPGPGDLDWETLATNRGFWSKQVCFLVHEVLGEGEAEDPGRSLGVGAGG